ncbi:MAG: aspartate--tRNA(Asn) ligase [Candidatus Korarchaeum sp.]
MGEEARVKVHGWVSEVRSLGKVRFVIIRNWNERIQVTMKKGFVDDSLFELTENLTQESVIEVLGREVTEKIALGADREVIPEKIIVHSYASPQLPLDPNWKVPAHVPTRFDNRPLDLRRPEVQAIFKIQSSLLDGMEDCLRRRGFIRVFTPALIGAASESGAEVFKVDYFDKEAYLRQDPQLHRQLTILGGFERIYDLGTNWRAELSRTPRHLSEFRSLAVEMAFIENEQDTMRIEEEIIREGIKRVVEERSKELEVLKVDLDIPKTPFPELRFPKIYDILADYGKVVEYGEDYDTEGERILWQYVKEEYDSDFFFVNRFPFKVKPFYVMKEDETWARSVDLLYKGLELSSGGQREHRYDVLISQIKEKGLDPGGLEWFTKFFAYGAPPHGGFAIGIERLLMKMLDLSSVKEASLFPRDPDRILP